MSLMSMEDLFYGPREATWILPTRDDRPYYREREFSPPRRYHPMPVPMRRDERFGPVDLRGLRPAMRPPPVEVDLRPLDQRARVHTMPQPVPVNVRPELVRKVVESPVVPSAVPPPTQVVMKGPAPGPPPPTQVVTNGPAPGPPPPTQVVAPKPALPAPAQVVQKRSVSPPRAIVHHPIELKVPMCCEKCAKKVKERLLTLEGVENVITDQYNQKVIVHGRADPSRVLHRVKLVKKRSVFWDITVDYSEKYRRARAAEDAALAREQSKAAVVKAETSQKAAAMVAPAPQVVVNLPPQQRGPQVTAILPPETHGAGMPYEVNSRVHHERYVSPPRAFRQEFVHGPREEMLRHPEFHHRRHSEVF